MPYIIGIDPGLTGAIAILTPTGTFVAVRDMPIKVSGSGKAKVKNEVDAEMLTELLLHCVAPDGSMRESTLYLEQVASFRDQGVAGVFSFGHSYGIVKGVAAALGLPLVLIRPAVWKKEFGLLKQKKDAARTYAIQLYPLAPLERKKDCGRADAILIARYGATR